MMGRVAEHMQHLMRFVDWQLLQLHKKAVANPLYSFVRPFIHSFIHRDQSDVCFFAGHTQSWGRGQPGLLTECYKGEKPNEYYGPFNPARNSTYDFMWKLLHELADVFPDKYLHLGGDEVDFRCWSTNPEVLKFMNNMGMGRDFSALQSYYTKQVVGITRKVTTKLGMVPVVWQEVFDH
ncbi:unnamed protein product [Echinostoma caproni]|uniref:Beta-hexosaminidase subunit alpha n=1 Tax=Echinostoma caproni TaxID=27848 RepID=A0A183A459_9TREM|nr:unnamed protein product [Echinostoma caproni]